MTRLGIIALVTAASLGCGSGIRFAGDADDDTDNPDATTDASLDEPDAAADAPDAATDAAPDVAGIDRPVDILVVVDNSMSMAEEQARLVENFPTLLDGILDPASGSRPVLDLHIGVVSTDLGTGGYAMETCPDPVDGDNGELQHDPSPMLSDCEESYPLFLSYMSESPDPTLIGEISTGFRCIATLGTDGCGFEQQLKASTRALIDHRDGVNAGFLRADSILVVVFLSDEEDCSVAPGSERIFDRTADELGPLNLRCFNNPEMLVSVSTYVASFGSLRTSPSDLLVSFIVGVPQVADCEGTGSAIGSCLTHEDMIERVDTSSPDRLRPACVATGGMTMATPARRFVQLAQDLGGQSHVQSICDGDFGDTIDWLVARINELAGD